MHKLGQLAIICSLTSLSFSQTEIGLKAGTASNFRDYITLSPEVKFSNWSVFISSSIGGYNENNDRISILQAHQMNPATYSYDSLGYVTMTNIIHRFLNFDLGGRYHYSINELNYFYSGISGGICQEERKYTTTYKTLDLYNPNLEYMPQYGAVPYPVLESSSYRSTSNNIAWRINLFTGFDIPLNDHFDINCELNAGFVFGSWQEINFWRSTFVPAFRGGIRYHLKA